MYAEGGKREGRDKENKRLFYISMIARAYHTLWSTYAYRNGQGGRGDNYTLNNKKAAGRLEKLQDIITEKKLSINH